MNHSEQTFIAVKSESIQRGLISEFISRFERRGLKLVACKMVVPNKDLLEKHYFKTDEWMTRQGNLYIEALKGQGKETSETALELGRKLQQGLVQSFLNKPVLAMIWEGVNAVALGRKTVGATDVMKADIGSIRGDYMLDSLELAHDIVRPMRTLVHASGTVDEAKDEIKIWFATKEVVSYPLFFEEILYHNNWGQCLNLEGKV